MSDSPIPPLRRPPRTTLAGSTDGGITIRTLCRIELNEHWIVFFGGVADAIVTQLSPTTVLDAGCAKGFLVAALRERGVDALGFDLSEMAIADAPEIARPHVRVGSLTEPIEGKYDLVTCVEVIEHLDPADATTAVANLASAGDRPLLSSTPADRDEPTHVNIQPPERWSQLFAGPGPVPRLPPRRQPTSHRGPCSTAGRAIAGRRRARLRPRLVRPAHRDHRAASSAILDMQATVEEVRAATAPAVRRRRATPQGGAAPARPRVGREAELATALGRIEELEAVLGRYANLEQRLNEVLSVELVAT